MEDWSDAVDLDWCDAVDLLLLRARKSPLTASVPGSCVFLALQTESLQTGLREMIDMLLDAGLWQE